MVKNSLCYVDTPIGKVGVAEDGTGICALFFADADPAPPAALAGATDKTGQETPLLREAAAQLGAYFAGQRKAFDLPLSYHGTPFQMDDWQALLSIPYGETRSYGQIAAQIGRPKAYRAVGMANHNNPIGIIIPCHRVIGSDGSPVGYGGGLERKIFLLQWEQAHA